ncbi:MAG TPA: DUF1905 domain-containing protein [Nocardioides sp.]|jgi:uncharacterized protein DUF1905|nr:DUF1905 domain-containing protein [Nocardioides sp.]
MELEFSGPLFEWRGPAPYHFVAVPEDEAEQLHETAAAVTYGWGMIPVTGRIGDTEFTTSLWPKDGGYVVPVKDAVRGPEGLMLGEMVTVRLTVEV